MGRKGADIPPDWERALAGIAARRRCRVLVVGGPDAGKSTFCRLLLGRLAWSGHKAAYVDGDLGQPDAGPPACVSLAHPDPEGHVKGVAPAALAFVGDVSPVGSFIQTLAAYVRVVRVARAPFLVVNTDGLVHDAGRPFRELLVDLIRPDRIVAIRRRDELDPLLAELAHRRPVVLKRSRRAWGRPTWDRQEHRARLFVRYFEAAGSLTLDAAALTFQRLPDGDPHLSDPAALPAALPPDRLLGLCDKTGLCLGLARVEGTDPAAGTLTVRTPVESDRVRVVQVGRMGVRGDGWGVD